MKISKLASTVVLTTSFATFFLFAILFYLYGDFKEALSDTASFFGGIATLVAAYIATQLFNDWRDVQSGTNRSEQATRTLRSLTAIQTTLDYYLSEVYIIANNYSDEDLEYCENLRNNIKNSYLELKTEFEINITLYEAVYEEKVSNIKTHDINDFNIYLFSINTALARIVKGEKYQDGRPILFYLKAASDRKTAFREKTVKNIASQLAPYILLNKALK